jgi:hypothetical protein
VLLEQRLGEARHPLGPVEIRAGDEAAQAPVAGGIPRQQHEVRPALALADPAQVLLDHRPVPGQAGPVRPGPCRQALDRFGIGECRPSLPCRSATRPPGGDDHARRVRRGGIDELDLDPDDRTHPGGLGCGGISDHAVQPVVVGDRQPGESERGSALGHLLDRGRAVQEREVAVAVELRVGA